MPNSSTPLRISAFYAASFVSFGIQIPFFPVLLAARGLDATAIAMVTTVPIVLRVTTASLAGSFADRLGDRRLALMIYSAAALIGVLTLGPARSFGALMFGTAAMALFWNGILPVTDAIASASARRGESAYGRMRLWGSIAFVVTNLVAGVVVAQEGAEAVWGMLVAGFAVQAVVALVLPRDRPAAPAAGDAAGKAAVAAGAAPKARVAAGAAPREGMRAALAATLADRRLMAVLIGAGLLQSSHAMLYGFASLHWAALGFSGRTIGVLWAIGVLGEIALFALSGAVLSRTGPRLLVALGAIGSVVRWSVFPFVGEAFPAWVAVQLLHAASFAAVHLGTIATIAAAVAPHRAATAQGVSVSITGFATALATILSGVLFRSYGGDGFAAMAVAAAAGGVIFVAAAQGRGGAGPQPHRAGQGGDTSEPS